MVILPRTSTALFSTKLPQRLCVGLRAESGRVWERRAALSPKHVKRLVAQGIPVLVQSSPRRVFPDIKYKEAGASIVPILSDADIIIGVKEVPVEELIPHKTYMFFSHTHKGQTKNMHMLRQILDMGIRLVDYELLTDGNGRRTVAFGRFAGISGAINGLQLLGMRMLALGYSNPFVSIPWAHMNQSLASAKSFIATQVAPEIKRHGVPNAFFPFTFVTTGSGNVTRGLMEILELLPLKSIGIDHLGELPGNGSSENGSIYIANARPIDYVTCKDGRPFSSALWRTSPSSFVSHFASRVAQFTSMLFTGHYWDPSMPRFLTNDDTKSSLPEWREHHRMLGLADVSADPEGAIQFMTHCTSIEQPWFVADVEHGREHFDIAGQGVPIMSCDILPTQFPVESSEFFGDALLSTVEAMTRGEFRRSDVFSATIAENCQLTPKHEHLKPLADRA